MQKRKCDFCQQMKPSDQLRDFYDGVNADGAGYVALSECFECILPTTRRLLARSMRQYKEACRLRGNERQKKAIWRRISELRDELQTLKEKIGA